MHEIIINYRSNPSLKILNQWIWKYCFHDSLIWDDVFNDRNLPDSAKPFSMKFHFFHEIPSQCFRNIKLSRISPILVQLNVFTKFFDTLEFLNFNVSFALNFFKVFRRIYFLLCTRPWSDLSFYSIFFLIFFETAKATTFL